MIPGISDDKFKKGMSWDDEDTKQSIDDYKYFLTITNVPKADRDKLIDEYIKMLGL